MLPSFRTLDGFALDSKEREGLAIKALEPGAALVVKTRHSSYRLLVLDSSRNLLLAEGGIFTEPTVVTLSGATFGGSTVKLGWILVGLRMELASDGQQITSSPVQSVTIERPSPIAVPDECAA